MIRRLLAHHAEQTKRAAKRVQPAPAPGYRPETLQVLLGPRRRERRRRGARGRRAHTAAAVTDGSEAGGSCAPRPCPASWPATQVTRTEAFVRLTGTPFVAANPSSQHTRVLGVGLVLDWLADQPGLSWQDRWLGSGADAAGATWRQVSTRWLHDRGHRVPSRQAALSEALPVLISADLIRPSLHWLLAGTAGQRSLVRNLAASRDPGGFTRLGHWVRAIRV